MEDTYDIVGVCNVGEKAILVAQTPLGNPSRHFGLRPLHGPGLEEVC